MKKISIITTAIVLALFLFLSRGILAQIINGDVNKDGQVNFSDYQLIQSLYGTTASSGDFNLNGIVDLFDINTVISNIYLKQRTTPSPTTVASNPSNTPTTAPPTATTKPTSGAINTPTQAASPTRAATPTTAPPPVGADIIGDIRMSYVQGGVWLTRDEIKAIPDSALTTSSWKDLVGWTKEPLRIRNDIWCTAGGNYGCTPDAKTPRALLARAIVGVRNDDTTMIDEVKKHLLEDVPLAIYENKNKNDEKWPERNIAPIALAANIIDYRPPELLTALRTVMYDYEFGDCSDPSSPDCSNKSIYEKGLHYLPNKPSWGKWSLLNVAYLLEDWDTINLIAKAHARALGEDYWNGVANVHDLRYTGMGSGDGWQEKNPRGYPMLVMPEGVVWNNHYIGGLWLADQYRAGAGPKWPPGETDYVWEGMAPNNTVSWALHHLGYKDVFKWGDYAMLRAMLYYMSSFDGKAAWPAVSNDVWQRAAIMTWAKGEFGDTLPDRLKPVPPNYPNSTVPWPIPLFVETKSSSGQITYSEGVSGRGMGWMYATHYLRLAK